MHPISSLPPAFNNSIDSPSAPAALLFLSRIIATRTFSWLGDGRYPHHRRLVSSVYFSSDVVAREQFCEMLLPYSHRILRIRNQVYIFISAVHCTGLRTLGRTADPLVELPASRHLDFRTLASFLFPFLPSERTPLFLPLYRITLPRRSWCGGLQCLFKDHVLRSMCISTRRTIGSVESGASIQWFLLRQWDLYTQYPSVSSGDESGRWNN